LALHNLRVPCEVFELQVLSAPQKGLSVLESLVLEAIYHGANNLDLLDQIFLLGHRSLLDLVSDLWRQGHLRVDARRGRFYVTENVVNLLPALAAEATQTPVSQEAGNPELEGGQRSFRTLRLVHDLLCNELLPEIQPEQLEVNSGKERLLQPSLALGSYRSLPAVVIEKAAIQRFGNQEEQVTSMATPSGRRRQTHRLIDFSFLTEGETGAASGVRFLRLQVETVQGATGRWRIEVVNPPSLSAVFRRRLSQRLTEIAEEESDGASVLRELLDVDALAAPPARPLGEMAREALSRAIKMEQVAPLMSLHEAARQNLEMAALARELAVELERLEEHQARVRWIRGSKDLEVAVRSSIGDAQNQLVLSSPVIRWARFRHFYDLIEKRLVEAVRVVILWGTTASSELEIEVRSALKALSRKGDLQWSHRPMRSHASFLLRDATLGIFSASSIFGEPTADFLSVLVRRSDASPPPAASPDGPGRGILHVGAVVDELARVQRTALEMHIEQAVVLPSPSSGPPADPRRLPEVDPRNFDDATLDQKGGLAAWAGGWLRWSRRISRDAEALGPSASVIHDREHLEWLETAIDSCPPWMVLGSGKISSRGLDRALETRLEALADGGTRLLVIDGQRPNHEPDLEAAKVLASLCRSFPERIRQIALPHHGGILATDQFMLVTSFELLDRPFRPTEDLNKRRLHTGLLVRGGKPIAEGIDLLLREHPEALRFLGLELPALVQAPQVPAPVDGVELDWAREELLRDLDRAGSELPPQTVYEQWLQRLPPEVSPLAAFSAVRSLLAPEFARSARLLALAQSEDSLKTAGPCATDEGRRHLGELAESLWREGHLFEALEIFAAVEARAAADDPVTACFPPRPIRRALATAGRAEFTEAVLEALELPPEEAVAAAATCFAIQVLAETASNDAFDLLAHFEPHAPAALRQAVAPLRTFYDRTLRPIPWARLAELRQTEGTKAAHARQLAAVREAFENAENVNFNFTLGVQTWQRLFAAEGPFGRLRGAVKAGDREVAQGWLQVWDRRGLEAAEVMDVLSLQVFRELDYIHEDRITHRRRANYVKRLDTLLDSLRAWTGFAAPFSEPSPDSGVQDALRDLSAAWPGLCADVDSAIPAHDGWEVPLYEELAALLAAVNETRQLQARLLGRLWIENSWRYRDLWLAGPEGHLPPERRIQSLLQGLVEPPQDPSKVMDGLLEEGRVEAGLRLAQIAGRDAADPNVLDRAGAGLRARRMRLLRRLEALGPSSRLRIEPPGTPAAGAADSERGAQSRGAELIRHETALQAIEQELATRSGISGIGRSRGEPIPSALPAALAPWPYTLSLVDTVRSLRDQPWRFGGWSPAGEPSAARLIDLLSSLLLEGAPLDRGWAAELAETLDQLLGTAPPPGGTTVRREDPYLIASLRALPPAWPDAVEAGPEGGWQLCIVGAGEERSEPGDFGRFTLFFDPLFDPKAVPDLRPEWALRIRPDLVFRTLIGPREARLYTWLCELTRQLPLDRLLLEGETGFAVRHDLRFLDPILAAATDPSSASTAPHRRVAIFLDIAGFRGLGDPEIGHLIELTGDHSYWIHQYLRHLCLWLVDQGRDRVGLTPEIVDEVWQWKTLHRAIARDVDALIDQRLDLAYLMTLVVYRWIETLGEDEVSREQIDRDNEVLDPERLARGLDELAERGLIRPENSIQPPTSAAGSYLIDLIMDRWDDIENRVRKFSPE
jgi:hypothetical protein